MSKTPSGGGTGRVFPTRLVTGTDSRTEIIFYLFFMVHPCHCRRRGGGVSPKEGKTLNLGVRRPFLPTVPRSTSASEVRPRTGVDII